jgi:hypothetical protein
MQMKRILPYFLCVCILFLGGFYLLRNSDQKQQTLQVQKNLNLRVAEGQGIQVVAKRPFIKRGEIGVLALKCAANTSCTIVCNYKVNGKHYCATRNLLTGTDGSVLCTWMVDKNTDIGNYEINITSGGNRLVTSYTVQ